MSAACFVIQSCLADADFVIFLNYCLISTRLIISLFAQADKESTGEEVIPDPDADVEENILHTLAVQRVREVVDALPEEDAALLRALYLQTPPLTLRAYSEKTGIPVMTLHYRKEKLLRLLKQQI